MSYPQSRQYCHDIVKRRAGNFGIALKFLPKEKRQALYAIYSFARMADDIVDGNNFSIDLETLKKELDHTYQHSTPDQYSWHANLNWAIRKFSLPKEYFDELLEGMQLDTKKILFSHWSETESYCYQAASTVGLLCLEIFGYSKLQAKNFARDLGIAMQLTNILRDLNEDFKRGRQYLPQEDFESFDLTFEDLIKIRSTKAAKSFLSFQIDRAQTYYEKATSLYPLVDRNSRFCPKALGLIYEQYLKQMLQDPLSCLKSKLNIANSKKIIITLRSRFFF